eukprot:TRINITY_DN12205_c0_g1_i1.p1 TRINITY_DN12205_c0_g1~~TRINITY_DN12205_c0_g1_i1.p1  ORF type:complete len:225 (-),score=59.99 TRINITY_DN12205_c0_g1_i1:192-866(-)
MVYCFFFFQAEDGIRDLVRSRGLGDVYKRQVSTQSTGQLTVDGMEEALPDIDPEVARQAQEYANEEGVMMAAPGTEQGSSGWYFDVDGSRSQWAVQDDEDGEPIWEMVQQFKVDETAPLAEDGSVTWVKVDLEATVITAEMSAAETQFNAFDLDGDGQLTAPELTLMVEWVFANFFPRRVLTEDEKNEEGLNLLRTLDKNEDSQIDFTEVRTWTQCWLTCPGTV